MRTISILCVILICGCAKHKTTECNYITDYYQTVYQADIAFESKDYETAFTLFQDAFRICEAKNTMNYNEIGKFTQNAAILEKYGITYEYAKKQILRGVPLDRFQNNDNFSKFLDSKFGQKLVLEYNELRKEFETNANFKLRDELIAMRTADQVYRSGNNREHIAKQDSIDKLHEQRLITIFETIGYPTDKMVGPHSINNPVDVGLFLLHTKDSIRVNYFIPKLKDFVKNGTASPFTLGTIIDQYHLYNGKPQIYGTYRASSGSGYANMIDDLKKVDSNRISIGLAPLRLKQKKDSLLKAKYGF